MADQQTETTVSLDELEARLAALPNPDAQMLFTAGEVRWMAGGRRARRGSGPQVWVCGHRHLVAIPADTPPYENPACPWCDVDRLRGLLLGSGAAWIELERTARDLVKRGPISGAWEPFCNAVAALGESETHGESESVLRIAAELDRLSRSQV